MSRHNDKSIKEVLGEYISKDNRVSKGYHTAQIQEIWKKEMGPIISGYTQKIYFKDGILKVYLTSAPLKKELLMGKEKIISIINEAAKENIVSQVEIY